jgi:hypothetical protein
MVAQSGGGFGIMISSHVDIALASGGPARLTTLPVNGAARYFAAWTVRNGSRKMDIPIHRRGEQGETMADSEPPESQASAAAPKVLETTPVAPAAVATSGTPASTGKPTTPETVKPGPNPAAPRIKEKRPTQRACDEKNEKGKICCGHLKRWYDYPPEIEKLIGKKAEIYRCEFCQTLYKPDLAEMAHSYTLRY